MVNFATLAQETKVLIEWIAEENEYRASINNDTAIVFAHDFKLCTVPESINFYNESGELISIVRCLRANTEIVGYGKVEA